MSDQVRADAVGFGVLAALLAAVFGALPAGSMSTAGWTGAFATAALASLLLRSPRIGPTRPRGWLGLAGASMLFAAIFFGANGALDALNGPRPSPLDSGGSLGGFELCYALCPGLTSVALAGWARSLYRRGSR